MSRVGGPVHDREPSRQMRELLAPGGFLAPLLEERMIDGVGLDVHLRRGGEVDLCCGLTCLVKGGRGGGGSVRVESHRTYAGQPCASGLFRPGRTAPIRRGEYMRGTWTVGEPGFAEALARFLDNVRIARRQTREGAVQARWSRMDEPWTVFDKEAALAYPSVRERRDHLSSLFSASVEGARRELGLTPADIPAVTGGIRAVAGFGDDTRSDEVRGRYARVLGIANAHLPPGVAAIETWVLARGRSPVRID